LLKRKQEKHLYWLKLLFATKYLNEETAESLIKDAEEICRIIVKIQITLKSNL